MLDHFRYYWRSFFFWLIRQNAWIWLSSFILLTCGLIVVLSVASMNHVMDVSMAHFWLRLNKKLILYGITLFVMIVVALTPLDWIKRLTIPVFICVVFLLFVTSMGWGRVVKGARRWISFYGISLQPSEILKPVWILFSSMILSQAFSHKVVWNWQTLKDLSPLLFSIVIVSILLLMQPDIGTTALMTTTILSQLFLMGLPFLMLFYCALCGSGFVVISYFLFPHVTKRINHFIGWSAMDRYGHSYQMYQSLQAFKNGKFFGVGLAEGEVKYHIPDAHNDFAIALLGEEVGFLGCFLILSVYCILIGNLLYAGYKKRYNVFTSTALCGIGICLLGQCFIHIASATGLIPPKGLTLPFISAGGTSLLSTGIMVGMGLCLSSHNEDINESIHKDEL